MSAFKRNPKHWNKITKKKKKKHLKKNKKTLVRLGGWVFRQHLLEISSINNKAVFYIPRLNHTRRLSRRAAEDKQSKPATPVKNVYIPTWDWQCWSDVLEPGTPSGQRWMGPPYHPSLCCQEKTQCFQIEFGWLSVLSVDILGIFTSLQCQQVPLYKVKPRTKFKPQT